MGMTRLRVPQRRARCMTPGYFGLHSGFGSRLAGLACCDVGSGLQAVLRCFNVVSPPIVRCCLLSSPTIEVDQAASRLRHFNADSRPQMNPTMTLVGGALDEVPWFPVDAAGTRRESDLAWPAGAFAQGKEGPFPRRAAAGRAWSSSPRWRCRPRRTPGPRAAAAARPARLLLLDRAPPRAGLGDAAPRRANREP
jgi:hypothetical protein